MLFETLSLVLVGNLTTSTAPTKTIPCHWRMNKCWQPRQDDHCVILSQCCWWSEKNEECFYPLHFGWLSNFLPGIHLTEMKCMQRVQLEVVGVDEETEMPGVHFPPNEKQVTVHCKAIWLVGTGEWKKRTEGSFWYLAVNCCLLHLFSSRLLTISRFTDTSSNWRV